MISRFEYPGPLQGYKNRIICPDDTLELAAYNFPGVNYVWRKDGNPLVGVVDQLLFESPMASDAGSYQLQGDYQVTFGNVNDSLINFFYYNGPDVINSTVNFPLADFTFSTTCVSGLDDASAKALNWSVYPVITSGLVEVNGLEKSQQLSVYNVMGHRIQQVSGGQTSTAIDLSGQMPGIYFIAVHHEDAISAKRVVLTQ